MNDFRKGFTHGAVVGLASAVLAFFDALVAAVYSWCVTNMISTTHWTLWVPGVFTVTTFLVSIYLRGYFLDRDHERGAR